MKLVNRFWRIKRKPSSRGREPRAVAESVVSTTSVYAIKFQRDYFTAISIRCRNGWYVRCLLFIVARMHIADMFLNSNLVCFTDTSLHFFIIGLLSFVISVAIFYDTKGWHKKLGHWHL